MKVYRPKEVGAILDLKNQTVYALIRSGDLKAIEVGAGKHHPAYRITQEALDAFIAQRTRGKSSV